MSFGSASLGVGAIEPPASLVAPLPARIPTRQTVAKHESAGYGQLLTAMRFMQWAIEQSHFPWPEQVVTRFGCSRATAHRWLNALAEVYGIERPRRGNHNELRQGFMTLADQDAHDAEGEA